MAPSAAGRRRNRRILRTADCSISSTSRRSEAPMAAIAIGRFKQPSVLPGFGLSLGVAITALSLIVLLPLAALVLRAGSLGPVRFWELATDPRTLAALKISFGTAFIAAAINAVFGLLLAWVLVRYRFPGRKLVDAAVDLPFALPTAVAGIALAAVYAPNGWIGTIAKVF